MKYLLTTIISLLTIGYLNAYAAEDSAESERIAERIAERKAERKRLQRIHRSRPVRLDEPLREVNISDEEVREIEAVMSKYFPGAIVNIAGVTVGCSCEDRPGCVSQVWVVAHRANRSNGLMLSQIYGNWMIGPVQKWWLRYDRLRSQMNAALASGEPNRFEAYRKLQEQQNQLHREFPSCGFLEISSS